MIGDQQDMQARLLRALPKGWFADQAPILAAVLSGFASTWAWLFRLIFFAGQQTRVATASSGWLDLIAYDYGGASWARNPNESDAAFRRRILFNMQRERTTRAALIANVTTLTGRAPAIFEPAFPPDTGGLSTPTLSWNTSGGWGTLSLPYQCFVTAYRPHGGGIANLSGWGTNPTSFALGGWNTGAIAWGDLSLLEGAVTDAEILSAVAQSMPAASIAWTALSN
ncbi:hypothetical protein [Acidisoma sp. C75]